MLRELRNLGPRSRTTSGDANGKQHVPDHYGECTFRSEHGEEVCAPSGCDINLEPRSIAAEEVVEAAGGRQKLYGRQFYVQPSADDANAGRHLGTLHIQQLHQGH